MTCEKLLATPGLTLLYIYKNNYNSDYTFRKCLFFGTNFKTACKSCDEILVKGSTNFHLTIR